MAAVTRPRGDESVAVDLDPETLAARAVAATALDELLADVADRPDHARLVVMLEVLGRVAVLAPSALTLAVSETVAAMP